MKQAVDFRHVEYVDLTGDSNVETENPKDENQGASGCEAADVHGMI